MWTRLTTSKNKPAAPENSDTSMIKSFGERLTELIRRDLLDEEPVLKYDMERFARRVDSRLAHVAEEIYTQVAERMTWGERE